MRQTNWNYVEHRILELKDNFLVFKIVDTILLSLMYSKCGYDTYCNSEQTLIGVRICFIIGIMRWVVGHAIRNVMSVYSVLLEVIVRNSKREPGIDSGSDEPLESSLQFIKDIIARRALALEPSQHPCPPLGSPEILWLPCILRTLCEILGSFSAPHPRMVDRE